MLSKSYTIWFSQRTGSSLLTTALEATRIAGRPHEWLETSEGKSLLEHYEVANGSEFYLKLRKLGSTNNGVFGAKVSFREPRITEVIHLLREVPDCPPDATRPEVWQHAFPNHLHIFMTRRNKVRLAVSWWRAIKSNQWHLRTDGNTLQSWRELDLKNDYDFDAITQLINESVMREAGIQEFFAESNIKPLTVTYEDFVMDYVGTIRRLLSSLELDSSVDIPSPSLSRIADKVTEVWVQRYRQERQNGWRSLGW
jgi:LPS sulfotransferase NodH